MARWQVPLGRAVVAVTALAFTGIGVWAVVTPATALDSVEVTTRGNGGLVELRAMYGGLQLGAALFFAWCAADVSRLRTGLVATVTMIGGLGGGRALGLVLDPTDHTLMYVFTALELSGAALAGALLVSSPSPPAARSATVAGG